MIENGFLAIFACPTFDMSYYPKNTPPPLVSILMMRWLNIRTMLGAGLIKLRGYIIFIYYIQEINVGKILVVWIIIMKQHVSLIFWVIISIKLLNLFIV